MKTVLLVEDSDDDVFAMKRACQRTGIPHSLRVVNTGDQAIEYLAGKGGYSDRIAYPFPDLVFLDIKLPGLDGHEVLHWVKSQPGMQSLPVVMLTGSNEPTDVQRAYGLGVDSFVRKISCPAEFGQAVRVILKYWLELTVAAP